MTTSTGITRSKVCVKCETDKLIDAFRKDKRTPDGYASICADCKGTKGKGGKKAKRATNGKANASPAPEPIASITSPLEVLPGFGFRASIEDDRLAIEQDRDDGATDNVTLSRTEAKVLFAQFGSWSGLLEESARD